VQIHISAGDGVPIYLQIVNQVKYLVASGRLKAGEELPPIRTLAERLIVNPNTVARAYREWSGRHCYQAADDRDLRFRARFPAGSPPAAESSPSVDALLAEARQPSTGR
jgi:GntR family transcriptional regulator